jgi:HEAT repeat protein
MLWVHLPAVYGAKFEPFLPDVLPLVLLGLADDMEPVRDASMRAAQAVIAAFREVSAGLLLPELQRGLAHRNYRIRQSSAELLGDLMLRLTNKEPMPLPDPAKGEDNAPDSPLVAVPVAQQHEMLAALYIARADATVGVKQAAHFVWKTLVANAPKALRIILPELTRQLIAGLSSEDEELQQAAARALGELVGKLAERVLPTLIPILQQGLSGGDTAHRQGVCLGLSELMGAAGREAVVKFLDRLIPCVRSGLCDKDGGVREAAAQSF